jgi:hypothetical protein
VVVIVYIRFAIQIPLDVGHRQTGIVGLVEIVEQFHDFGIVFCADVSSLAQYAREFGYQYGFLRNGFSPFYFRLYVGSLYIWRDDTHTQKQHERSHPSFPTFFFFI